MASRKFLRSRTLHIEGGSTATSSRLRLRRLTKVGDADVFSLTFVAPRPYTGIMNLVCQSASKFDPPSASNFDPLERRGRAVALAPSELAGVAETARARVGM